MGRRNEYVPGSSVSTPPNMSGRFPANVLLTHNPDCDTETCAESCPVAELDAQSGDRPGMRRGELRRGSTTGRSIGGTSAYGTADPQVAVAGYDDSGGASRFFPTFRYQAKAPKAERPKVDGVAHPTVKPLELMRWLVRLVTPPGGTVLDPFAGSGTTVQAATEEGFSVIGIEREPEYWPLIEHRTGVAVTPYVVEAEPGPVDIFGAACAVHGPHPGTVTCLECLEITNKIVGNVLAVATDKALSSIPGMNRIEEQALAAETVVDAELARDALRDLLTEFQTSSQPA